MKKYNKPTILIAKISLTRFIAMSNVQVGTGKDEYGEGDPCSKGNTIWENMDED